MRGRHPAAVSREFYVSSLLHLRGFFRRRPGPAVTTRILGIDPGSRLTGYGVIDVDGGKLTYVTSGTVNVRDEAWPERLRSIFLGVSEIMQAHAPHEIAIEKVFMNKNADSALKLGQARGAALCAALLPQLTVCEYTPTQIKQATVGKGHAAKEQIQHMVRLLLKLPEGLSPDSADALAVALCHAHTRQTLLHMRRAQQRVIPVGVNR